ncbi:MAG: site-specific integrase, partial [Phycisphaerae bacterium]|nr:site-specific integrase [Phycisphaerae bacterium]
MGIMDELPLIKKFLDYIDSERNFSAHTVRSYAADLGQFCRFLAGTDTLADSATEPLTADQLPEPDELPSGGLEERLLAAGPTEIRAYLAMMRNSEYSKG